MAAICLENTNARRIPIISEEVTQGMEFELGVVSENGGLEMVRMREKEEQVMIQLGLPRTSSYTV
jgi:hypothetical protein